MSHEVSTSSWSTSCRMRAGVRARFSLVSTFGVATLSMGLRMMTSRSTRSRNMRSRVLLIWFR